MEAAALTFGILGFVFAMVPVSGVNNLKKELKRLRRNAGD